MYNNCKCNIIRLQSDPSKILVQWFFTIYLCYNRISEI